MIEAILAKIIGGLFGLVGFTVTIIVQAVLWFFGTFVFGGIVWLIYTLTHRRKS